MGVKLAAALWGLAEATFFFIVPDVLLSMVGIRHLRKALIAGLYALGGALTGGVIMYAWGASDQEGALRMLDYIPAISPEMLARVEGELADLGPFAVLQGPLLGTPYKTYAVQAASAGLGFVPFLLISIPARLIRFALVTTAVHWLAKWLAKDRLKLRYGLAIGGWMIFYTAYFSFMPN